MNNTNESTRASTLKLHSHKPHYLPPTPHPISFSLVQSQDPYANAVDSELLLDESSQATILPKLKASADLILALASSLRHLHNRRSDYSHHPKAIVGAKGAERLVADSGFLAGPLRYFPNLSYNRISAELQPHLLQRAGPHTQGLGHKLQVANYPFSLGLLHKSGNQPDFSGEVGGVKHEFTLRNPTLEEIEIFSAPVSNPPAWKLNYKIGSGAYGTVFLEKVQTPKMDSPELWAVKRISRGLPNFPAKRYQAEIKNLQAVSNVRFTQIYLFS